jgi:predicted amidohydrolase YtcJ
MKTTLLIFTIFIMISSFALSQDYMPKQLKVVIEKGMITEVSETKGKSVIIIDGKKLEFKNAYLLPGLCDSHGHLIGLGHSLTEPDFSDSKSAKECIDIAKNYKPNRGKWLYGRGWNHERWIVKELPNKEILDSAYPNTPVIFRRTDGHSIWVNSRALELAKIDKNTLDPQGGKILRDKYGEPTGLLIDNAVDEVMNLLPELTESETINLINIGEDKLLSYGLTEIHDIDISPEDYLIMQKMADKNLLKIRIEAYISAQNNDYLKFDIKPTREEFLSVRGLKFYADGALGSYGAALSEPYSDKPETSGLLLIPSDSLYKKVKIGLEKGFDIAIHSIGDRANHNVLDLFGRLRNEIHPKNLLRVEHSQLLAPEEISKYAKYDAIASIQPIHCISDAKMADKRLGKKRATIIGYKWKSLIDAGAKMLAGSDFPIESPNPFLGIDAFVNRVPFDEVTPWNSKECIGTNSALKIYSFNPREYLDISNRGTIKKGNQADIIIIDRDLKNPKSIKDTKVIMTIVNGKIVFQK